MTDLLVDQAQIDKRVFVTLQGSAYVERFLARKFGASYSPKSPSYTTLKVYKEKERSPRVKVKGLDDSPFESEGSRYGSLV